MVLIGEEVNNFYERSVLMQYHFVRREYGSQAIHKIFGPGFGVLVAWYLLKVFVIRIPHCYTCVRITHASSAAPVHLSATEPVLWILIYKLPVLLFANLLTDYSLNPRIVAFRLIVSS